MGICEDVERVRRAHLNDMGRWHIPYSSPVDPDPNWIRVLATLWIRILPIKNLVKVAGLTDKSQIGTNFREHLPLLHAGPALPLHQPVPGHRQPPLQVSYTSIF